MAAEARAAEAAKKRVLALEIEKTRKKEAARREIARLDALRREEARAAMRREADVLEAKRLLCELWISVAFIQAQPFKGVQILGVEVRQHQTPVKISTPE